MENVNLTPEDVVAKINSDVTEKLKGVASLDEVNEIKNDVETLKTLELKSVDTEKAIAKLEGKLEALAEKAVNEPVKGPNTLGDQVTKGIKEDIETGRA